MLPIGRHACPARVGVWWRVSQCLGQCGSGVKGRKETVLEWGQWRCVLDTVLELMACSLSAHLPGKRAS